MGGPNLPLTISVFTPLTLGRHPAAGRLPFGALAPEVGWFGGFRGTADGTSGRTLRRGEGVVPDRCRYRGRSLGASGEPGAGAAATAAANSQCRGADANDRHAGGRNCRSQCGAAAAVAAGQFVE